MLTQIAEGVQVHVSDFMQSNAVVVRGETGVLLIDPGIREEELVSLARDLPHPVVAGFSTHPHWDHLLWHPDLGSAPRYGTMVGAAAIGARLSTPDWKSFVTGMLPPDIADQVPLNDAFGRITGVAAVVPWDGPAVHLIEHNAHAPGHAALLIPSRGVLVAGDMLSDVLVPILNAMAPDPIGDYLAALDLLASREAEVVIPGHGSVGNAEELPRRIAQDREYVEALRDGREPDDPRIGSSPKPGWEWVSGLHARQAQSVANN